MRSRLPARVTAVALALPLLAVLPSDPPPAAAASAEAPSSAQETLRNPALDALPQKPYAITLITGDRVALNPGPDGRFSVDAEPATRPDGSTPELHLTSLGSAESLYVVSDDVLGEINAGRVDRQLFDVAYLAANGYAGKEIPLIIGYKDKPGASTLAARTDAFTGTSKPVALKSAAAAATTVTEGKSAAFWASMVGKEPGLAKGVGKVWLDAKVTVDLEQSVPQVGAPEAWQAGFDGKDVKVAVLDTGIDETHPDVAGKVVASKSFIDGEEVKDGHGHGTHVAATVAGSGAASEGRRKGVAPGADLLVGKVLNNEGSGTLSEIVGGMEWAADEMDADIISMSLGSEPTDGTDPLSTAVNSLTESTGALFVIAAGNNGKDFTVNAPATADRALAVGAVDKSDKLASFSSRGPRRGDYGLKPEISAPGAGIIAARAAGTTLGTPVDDRYTSLNGTSMATPHVAGAAAILAQQHPDWSADQLKSGLVASAKDVGLTAYQQGAGRLDVAQAVRQQVQVSPATLDLGFFRHPVEGDALRRTVTYTNPGDTEIVLGLTGAVRAADGTPFPDGALTLDTDTLTVPAGGTATATVTVDHRSAAAASYTGSLVASSAVFSATSSAFTWLDDSDTLQTSRLVDPEVTVDGDTNVLLDAAKAVRPTYSTPQQSEGHSRSFGMQRWVPEDVAKGSFFISWYDFTLGTNARRDNLWISPTKQVTKGKFTVALQTTRVAPPVTMKLGGRSLDVQYPLFNSPIGHNARVPDPSKLFSGTRSLPLADVGYGTPDELAKADLRGKLVVVRRNPEDLLQDNRFCLPSNDTLIAIAKAGAAGIVMSKRQYTPDLLELSIWCDRASNPGEYDEFAEVMDLVPLVRMPWREADRLSAAAASGGRATVTGTPRTPYFYQLKPYMEGRIPDRLDYRMTGANLATIEHDLHAAEPGWQAVTAAMWKPYEPTELESRGAHALPPFAPSPWKVTEYYGPVSSDTVVRHAVGTPGITSPRQVHYGVYGKPGRTTISWNDGPRVPAVVPQLATTATEGYPGPRYAALDLGLCTGCRQGDVFWPYLRYSASADPNQIESDGTGAVFGQFRGDPTVRLERADGTEVPQAGDPVVNAFLGYKLPPERQTYKLTHTTDATTTAWTFTSGAVTKNETTGGYRCMGTWLEDWVNRPPTATPCRPEPLLFPRYDLGLDSANQVRPGRHRFELSLARQPSATRPAATAGLTVELSRDGGATWTKADVRPGRAGSYTVQADLSRFTGPVGLRVAAWDQAGNRVEQTVKEAFTVR
ncbi:S8 family serine peptidase [Nonomuraea sp. MG754425]|uniref:S8 family peptidase n=1 Tax=Nonomuraea sp. MG754425 TaxID=2570319 RepID=UPI001F00C51C|nr:S8 family serine peptidase [Nonomuraea sp. MG754425]